MRKFSVLSYNMTYADGADKDGMIPVGRQFDLLGNAETENLILADGDESLALGYRDVECYEKIYVGDMVDFKSDLINIGNTSRDCHVEVYKLATPASRAGKEDCKQGEMIWFDEPVLCSTGTTRLVVKKYLQRGAQPDGTVKTPWGHLDDFPETEADDREAEEIIFRYRMSDRDKFYGGGVVNGARSVTLAGDAAARVMAKQFHNTGHCVGVNKIRFYVPSFAGDYLEFHAKLLRMEGDAAVIQVRSYKIITLSETSLWASSSDVLSEPLLSMAVEFKYRVI